MKAKCKQQTRKHCTIISTCLTSTVLRLCRTIPSSFRLSYSLCSESRYPLRYSTIQIKHNNTAKTISPASYAVQHNRMLECLLYSDAETVVYFAGITGYTQPTIHYRVVGCIHKAVLLSANRNTTIFFCYLPPLIVY